MEGRYMSLGSDLKSVFDSKASSPSALRGEVALFRYLIEAFDSIGDHLACEIHGNKSQVRYVETAGWLPELPVVN